MIEKQRGEDVMTEANERHAREARPKKQKCTAFAGSRLIASGELSAVALEVKQALDAGAEAVLIFDDMNGDVVELDFRGNVQDVLLRLERMVSTLSKEESEELQRGPGRPKLGVVAREVTLLPRHWDWLGKQPGGASVALRKLVDEARKSGADNDAVRHAQEVSYRFMSAMAGNLPGFEEASRALFAGNLSRFHKELEAWPRDIANHSMKLAHAAFK
jgi:hypothetical protein